MARAFTTPTSRRPYLAGDEEGYTNPYDDPETLAGGRISSLPQPPSLERRPNALTLTPPPTLSRDRRQNQAGTLLAVLGGLLGGNREAAAGFGAAYGQGFTRGEDNQQRRRVENWQRQQQQDAMINADKWRQFESANRQAGLEWQMQNQAAANLRGEEARAERDKRQAIEDTRYEEGLKREAGNTWYNRWRDAMESKRRNEQDAERGGGRKIGLRVQYLRDVLRDQTATPEARQGALSELQSLFGGNAPGSSPIAWGIKAPSGVKPTFLPMSPAASANIKMGQDRLKQGSDRMKQSASQFAQRLQFLGAQGAANRAVRLQTAPKPKSDKLTQSQALSLAARYDGMAGDLSKSPEERAKAAAMAKSLRDRSGVKLPKALGDMTADELRAAIKAPGGSVAPRSSPAPSRTSAPPAKSQKRTFTPPRPKATPKPKAKKPAVGEKIGRFIVEG